MAAQNVGTFSIVFYFSLLLFSSLLSLSSFTSPLPLLCIYVLHHYDSIRYHTPCLITHPILNFFFLIFSDASLHACTPSQPCEPYSWHNKFYAKKKKKTCIGLFRAKDTSTRRRTVLNVRSNDRSSID